MIGRRVRVAGVVTADEMVVGDDTLASRVHAVLDAAAQHRHVADTGLCSACGGCWPCADVLFAIRLWAAWRQERNG